jgi:hypothetical protein
MTDTLADDLLRGAEAIGAFLYGDDPAARRRVYHLRDKLPVWTVDGSSILHALKSQLRAHTLAKSEQKAEQIAATAAAAAAMPSRVRSRRVAARRSRSG